MNIISCENVSFEYRHDQGEDAIKVFQHLDFTVEKGQFTVILGHNGSGKSTLAKHFNSILLPTSGKVYVLGKDTTNENDLLYIRSHLGMVFQNPDNQIVATIVEEDVAFGLENMGTEPLEIRKRVDEALKTVDMYDFREHAPHQLSGGQKQRVAIAGVLAMNPDCIVLDEPTAMLDPKGRKEVMQTLLDLNKQGITIVLITHYMDEAAKASRVVVMDHGEIIKDGTALEVFSNVEDIKKVGLDVPQSSELLYRLKKAGIEIPEMAINFQDTVEILSQVSEKIRGNSKND